MEQIVLNKEQHLYLQFILNHFREANQWPTVRQLDHFFNRHHPDLDIEEIWKSMPPGLTSHLEIHLLDEKAKLTVPGIYALEPNAPEFELFLAIIQLCVDVFLASESREMGSEDILRHHHWYEPGVYRVGWLLLGEPDIWQSFAGPDQSGQWRCTIARGIRRFRGISTIEDYLEKRDSSRSRSSISHPSDDVPFDTNNVSKVFKKMFSIELQHRWNVGSAIAEGGFGKIYEAKDEKGTQAVIKLIPMVRGASRELLFENVSNHQNVIPIWDFGEWGDYYVLVMPRAEKSLRQHLEEVKGQLSTNESLAIITDIAEAFVGLEQDVVHRDLKPENILLYQRRWCLADFGIARYAEATTAPDTHKYSFTAQYASPEQWRSEHATPAADVYAFGVMAFELFQGHRPFLGPSSWNFREQHLNQPPPPLTGTSPSIASLITECLYKSPQARPTPANILMRLRKNSQPSSLAAARLQSVNQRFINKRVQADASDSAQKSVTDQRKELFSVARQPFEVIFERLVEQIRDAAPSAVVTQSPYLTVQLGSSILSVEYPLYASYGCLSAFNSSPAFDVIAYGSIKVSKPRDRFGYEGRSHSLWFCDAHSQGVYRWFETAFMIMPLIPVASSINPFALSPRSEEAAEAFSRITSEHQIAWEPLPFDQGNEDQFIERWLGWFASAADGTLSSPLRMPEASTGHHRS